MASPEKRNVDVVAAVYNLDAPELLGYKVLDSEVAIYHKAKGRELTRAFPGIELLNLSSFPNGTETYHS
jgi:hypothetical protein